jgi:hypothetical protein
MVFYFTDGGRSVCLRCPKLFTIYSCTSIIFVWLESTYERAGAKCVLLLSQPIVSIKLTHVILVLRVANQRNNSFTSHHQIISCPTSYTHNTIVTM